MRRGLALLLLAMPLAAGAQSVRIGGRCMPVAEPDSIDVVLTARVRGLEAATLLPQTYLQVLADEIRRRVALPDPLPLTTYDVSLQRNDRVYPGGAVVTEFALASNGQLAALFVDTTLTLSALDTALLSAIFRATADTAVPPFPQDVALDTAFFQLQLVVGERVDRLDAIWARARVPTYRLSSMPVPDSANPMPMYRSLARGTRASGVTRVQFSVTAAGTVSPGSVRAVEGFNARAFGAIVDAVRQWRFRPATIGDCPVAVIMRRDFDYSVR